MRSLRRTFASSASVVRRGPTTTGGRPATTGVIPGRYALSVGKPERPLPEGWRWELLTEVARLESGHTPSRRHPEYWAGDIPWIGIGDATANHGRTLTDTEEHVAQAGIDNSSARVLPAGTVCLSRTASIGYVVTMGRPMATSQDFVNWVCSPRLDPRFLKYVLLAERDSYAMFASGTTHQTIYFPEVKAFHIALPPIADQRQIADALGAFDDKIDLNLRLSDTLESTARTLYRSWFVDFDSPQASGADGWPGGALGDLADLNPEVWPIRDRPSVLRYVDLSGTKWGRIGAVKEYPADGAPSRAQRVLRPGDTIVGTVRPGNGSYALVMRDGLTGSTGFAQLRPKQPRDAAFVYLAATARGNIDALAHLADGGAYPAVRPTLVAATPVVVPDDRALQAFSLVASPLLARAALAIDESESLGAMRDALLPRLLSGDFEVAA